MHPIRTAFVSGAAFLAGFVLLVLVMLGTLALQTGPAGVRPGDASATDAAYLSSIQGLVSAVTFALVTTLARSWRVRRPRTHAVVGFAAGVAAYLLGWTGLLFVGLSARALGLTTDGAGTALMTWMLAAWPGFALGLVVVVGALIVAPPRAGTR